MKKKYITFTILIALNGFYNTISAQQTPVFANYNYNALTINPAHAGNYSDTDVTVISRGYFNQFEGSPRNIGLTFSTPLNSGKVGIGMGVISDQVGVTNSTAIFGSYSYKLFFRSQSGNMPWWEHQPHMFSFGIMGGITQYKEDLLKLKIQGDPNFENNINALVPTFGVGFLYNHRDFYLGFSAPNLLGSSLSSEKNINLKSNYYVNCGYRFFTSLFQEILITPSTLVKYISGAPVQIDVNLTANYKNKLEIGGGYRTDSSMSFLVGFYFSKNFRLVYNYNQAFMSNPINNTHGIILSCRLGEGYIN
ncbi:PorP/SprF family type IX secretion system membrane protein [Mariniflexile sp. HMF6888]|uniref:PorP/SprF family type IX secretion system membrane protein n=1 Tax=Mariniflexile sp. HMF6888 TaxID=3373086 RepID=UPI0037B56F99